jgi:hypothetical protein
MGGDKQAILVRNTGDGIFKQLRSPGIDSKESIPPPYVAWQPCSYSVPSPHRLFLNFTTGEILRHSETMYKKTGQSKWEDQSYTGRKLPSNSLYSGALLQNPITDASIFSQSTLINFKSTVIRNTTSLVLKFPIERGERVERVFRG